MGKVRIYQDIDCCLNASHNARAWRDGNDSVNAGYCKGFATPIHDDDGDLIEGHEHRTWVKYKMEWNSRVIDAYNDMDIELVWATTWREDAHAVGRLMGLNHLGRVLHPQSGRTTFPSIEWKYDAVLADQQRDPGPFIWVEDELSGMPAQAKEIIHQLGGLMVSPDPNLGITPADIERMKAYIAEHA